MKFSAACVVVDVVNYLFPAPAPASFYQSGPLIGNEGLPLFLIGFINLDILLRFTG